MEANAITVLAPRIKTNLKVTRIKTVVFIFIRNSRSSIYVSLSANASGSLGGTFSCINTQKTLSNINNISMM